MDSVSLVSQRKRASLLINRAHLDWSARSSLRSGRSFGCSFSSADYPETVGRLQWHCSLPSELSATFWPTILSLCPDGGRSNGAHWRWPTDGAVDTGPAAVVAVKSDSRCSHCWSAASLWSWPVRSNRNWSSDGWTPPASDKDGQCCDYIWLMCMRLCSMRLLVPLDLDRNSLGHRLNFRGKSLVSKMIIGFQANKLLAALS